jgi:hypothetical protein
MSPSDSHHKLGGLRVLREQTINGKTFPLEYTCEQFRPQFPGDPAANDEVPQASATVRVRTISLHAVPEVRPPEVRGKTGVMDGRYTTDRQGEPVTFPRRPGHIVPDGMYFLSRGRLPEEPDVKALKKYEGERDARSKAPPLH